MTTLHLTFFGPIMIVVHHGFETLFVVLEVKMPLLWLYTYSTDVPHWQRLFLTEGEQPLHPFPLPLPLETPTVATNDSCRFGKKRYCSF